MEYIVIGTHGLFNKPSPEKLKDGWNKALIEGLRKNQNMNIENVNFEMIYWADFMYDEYDKNPELYREAKEGSLKEYKDGWKDSIKAVIQGSLDTPLDFAKRLLNIDFVVDEVLERTYKDLYRYYKEDGNKEAIRNRFIEFLHFHKDKKIILVAHSMGTIVAYESLIKLHQKDPSVNIEYFITIGSPLGLPHVKYRVDEEFDKTTTPENVSKWLNFADKRDRVALDTHLRDDYDANSKDVRVVDNLIFNDWEGNAHKSYGYLRTPEFSEAISIILKGAE